MTESGLLSYFFSLGFVTLYTIQQVEKMEGIEISKNFEEVNHNYETRVRICHFKSRKVLAYSDTKDGEAWLGTIHEIYF